MTKRIIVAMTVDDDTEIGDHATNVEAVYRDSNPTVWATAEDFIADYQEGTIQ